jgi:hypothetical protein
MEEEIKEEFKKSGFSLDDEEEVLKKCKPCFALLSLNFLAVPIVLFRS